MSLMQQTTVTFTITIDDDNEQAIIKLIGLLLLPFMLIWQVWQAGVRAVYEVRLFVTDVSEATGFVNRTWPVRLKILVYEMIGIRLWQEGKLYRRCSGWL